MNLAQIGGEIHNKRIQAGLLQAQVAKFAGLSRVTINKLENGTLTDLGYTKLKAAMIDSGPSVAVPFSCCATVTASARTSTSHLTGFNLTLEHRFGSCFPERILVVQ